MQESPSCWSAETASLDTSEALCSSYMQSSLVNGSAGVSADRCAKVFDFQVVMRRSTLEALWCSRTCKWHGVPSWTGASAIWRAACEGRISG